MSQHIYHLLSKWHPQKDSTEWVLGTVFATEGPCYRKAGAMMLFSGDGQQLGMLSGGCLESDIQLQAKKVMAMDKPMTLTYDSQDEDDLSFQLGIGCGGSVDICLHPVSKANQYLALEDVYNHLKQRKSGHYYQQITSQSSAKFISSSDAHQLLGDREKIGEKIKEGGTSWLRTFIQPPTHLLIAGGGLDARPITTIAKSLGWQVTLWDPRPANARKEHFPDVQTVVRTDASTLSKYCNEQHVDALVVMSHSVSLDAAVLESAVSTSLKYIALLGPLHRKEDVFRQSCLNNTDLPCKVYGPAGLNLGAALPEGIAISILSECVAVLNGADANSLSGIETE
ncbi:XdhC family protein [Enterovibrio coralii]|uniref:Isoquinoline 1-oxidoreductase n=1 Tax=Enterovibrio coralii TaxID=294935 RepID=A0A135ICV2_9GAMM|nr:XdhC/CoxI family protein [Enterovibrio coralii]KXF83307.1 isoquinoline 1-oxidoreductase [Enterovibrio coralii]